MSVDNYKPIIFTVDGNIGSGKSTFISELKNYIKNISLQDVNIVFVQEPVDEWNKITDKNGDTILTNFYRDQDKYAFSFQIMAIVTRYEKLLEAISEAYILEKETNNKSYILVERSIITDKYIFAKMLYESGKISDIDYKIYNKWYNIIHPTIKINKILYIQTSPTICKQRIINRNRNGEDNIDIEYLNQCHTYHENMMTIMEKEKVNVYRIDCEKDDIYKNSLKKNIFLKKILDDLIIKN